MTQWTSEKKLSFHAEGHLDALYIRGINIGLSEKQLWDEIWRLKEERTQDSIEHGKEMTRLKEELKELNDEFWKLYYSPGMPHFEEGWKLIKEQQ